MCKVQSSSCRSSDGTNTKRQKESKIKGDDRAFFGMASFISMEFHYDSNNFPKKKEKKILELIDLSLQLIS